MVKSKCRLRLSCMCPQFGGKIDPNPLKKKISKLTMPKKQLTAWEIAKPILEREFLAGNIKADWPRGRVHKFCDEFEAVPINNFGNNWNRMKASIGRLQSDADRDAAAFCHDMLLHPIDYTDRWDGSLAQFFLKEDVADGFHLHFAPKDLWLSREEYRAFELEIFTKHVHQESRSKLETTYWLNKKWKKAEKTKKITSLRRRTWYKRYNLRLLFRRVTRNDASSK